MADLLDRWQFMCLVKDMRERCGDGSSINAISWQQLLTVIGDYCAALQRHLIDMPQGVAYASRGTPSQQRFGGSVPITPVPHSHRAAMLEKAKTVQVQASAAISDAERRACLERWATEISTGVLF